MAISMMTSADRKDFPGVSFMANYPGVETGRIEHGNYYSGSSGAESACSKYGRSITFGNEEPCSYCGRRPAEGLWMETTHVGLVLSLNERNGYDDSDFYALVWSPTLGRPERIEYASTCGWTYPNNAQVDATPEVVAAYEGWLQRCQDEARAAQRAKLAAEQAAAEKASREAEALRGKVVQVIRGKGRGAVGPVVWVGPSKFSAGYCVGVQVAGKRIFANVVSVRMAA